MALADLSAASSVLPPPPPPIIHEPDDNMHSEELPPSSDPPMANGVKHEDSESELSDPSDPTAASASPPPMAIVKNENSMEVDEMSSEDAEAEDDGDFEVDAPPQQVSAEMDGHSSSDESIRPAKRKAQAVDEEDEYMRNNPDLYGLRRSGRARLTMTLAESSGDEDDDSDVPRRPRKRLRQASGRSSKQPTPVVESPSPSDSESDNYGGRRGKLTKKQKHRFLHSGNLTPSHAEVRFSTRRSAKVSNYNEDDDEEMFLEDDAENLTPNYWVGEEDNSPAIDIVLNHRLRADVTAASYQKEDYEFLIKWQQRAYYHATWETTESLSNVRSLRRLDNYIKKILMEEERIINNPNIPPEDKEKWMLDREQHVDTIEDYKKVERVIGKRDVEEGMEYFVKWRGLFYDNATWEPASLISDIAQNEIDKYINRLHEDFRSTASEINPNTRATFIPIREQPAYIQNGTLRDFQLTGLNFLAYNWVKGKNVVLADEMGLGKTVQTVSFMSWLRHDRDQQGPFLVAVPLSTMPAWADTFDHWAPDVNYVVYNGNQTARNIIKDYELLPTGSIRHPQFHVLLTTYEYVLQDAAFLSQIKWQFMAIDEAHRLKNRESQLYDKLQEFKAPARLLITGTPVQNNLSELSSLFDFLAPGVVNIDENMDLTTEAASAKITQLTEDIKPYMLRRTKAKVEKDLPPKTEKIIRVELSDIQLEYYKNILTKNYAALNQGAKGPKQSLLNIMMELKKASNHPFLFPSAEERMVAADARRDEVLRALVTSSGKIDVA